MLIGKVNLDHVSCMEDFSLVYIDNSLFNVGTLTWGQGYIIPHTNWVTWLT